MPTTGPLNEQETRFLDMLIDSHDGTRFDVRFAAQAAGVPGMGWKMLRRPHVKAELLRRMRPMLERIEAEIEKQQR